MSEVIGGIMFCLIILAILLVFVGIALKIKNVVKAMISKRKQNLKGANQNV